MRKALGISWNAASDELTYTITPVDYRRKITITKRLIVSKIAKIFDPLGLLGPVILELQVIIQECWKSKVGWDQTVPQVLHTKNLTIPRYLLLPNYMETQIHGFCDASRSGYGACLYVQSSDAEGRVLIRLACAKSRFAPDKQLPIPRLQLCGPSC